MLVFAVHWTITASASDCNRELHRRRYYSACKVKTQLLKNLGSFCRHDHLYLSELCCHQKTATECLCVPYSDIMVLVIKGNVWEVSCLFFNFAAIDKIAKYAERLKNGSIDYLKRQIGENALKIKMGTLKQKT